MFYYLQPEATGNNLNQLRLNKPILYSKNLHRPQWGKFDFFLNNPNYCPNNIDTFDNISIYFYS